MDVNDLYIENHKTWMKEIEEDTIDRLEELVLKMSKIPRMT
jgi:hypothetical protein